MRTFVRVRPGRHALGAGQPIVRAEGDDRAPGHAARHLQLKHRAQLKQVFDLLRELMMPPSRPSDR